MLTYHYVLVVFVAGIALANETNSYNFEMVIGNCFGQGVILFNSLELLTASTATAAVSTNVLATTDVLSTAVTNRTLTGLITTATSEFGTETPSSIPNDVQTTSNEPHLVTTTVILTKTITRTLSVARDRTGLQCNRVRSGGYAIP